MTATRDGLKVRLSDTTSGVHVAYGQSGVRSEVQWVVYRAGNNVAVHGLTVLAFGEAVNFEAAESAAATAAKRADHY